MPEHQEAKFQGHNDKNKNKKKYLIGGSIFAIILLIIILVVTLKKKDDSGNNPDPTPPSPIPEGFNIYSVDQTNLTNSPYMMTGVLLANASP